jgi:hypothetical protein
MKDIVCFGECLPLPCRALLACISFCSHGSGSWHHVLLALSQCALMWSVLCGEGCSSTQTETSSQKITELLIDFAARDHSCANIRQVLRASLACTTSSAAWLLPQTQGNCQHSKVVYSTPSSCTQPTPVQSFCVSTACGNVAGKLCIRLLRGLRSGE